jgi:hypothetical protein
VREKKTALSIRLVKGFAMFWWDFLVGDTPEIFVAVLVVIGVVSLVRIVLQWSQVAVVVLPLLAIVALFLSVRRAQKASRD